VIGNVIGQSATTDNRDLVSYGAEGRHWPDNALYLAHNTLIDDRSTAASCASGPTGCQRASEVWAINNLLVGPWRLHAAGAGSP
jgi:hypothetical protein